jgi:hypothetical protein
VVSGTTVLLLFGTTTSFQILSNNNECETGTGSYITYYVQSGTDCLNYALVQGCVGSESCVAQSVVTGEISSQSKLSDQYQTIDIIQS